MTDTIDFTLVLQFDSKKEYDSYTLTKQNIKKEIEQQLPGIKVAWVGHEGPLKGSIYYSTQRVKEIDKPVIVSLPFGISVKSLRRFIVESLYSSCGVTLNLPYIAIR